MESTPIIADVPAFLALYAAFAIKHFLADFLCQPGWVAAGKCAATGWARPLAMHAAMHAVLTMLIATVVVPSLWWLGILDFVLHCAIDRTKAVLSRRLALQPADDAFWWAFGADQLAHQLTHIVWVVVLASSV